MDLNQSPGPSGRPPTPPEKVDLIVRLHEAGLSSSLIAEQAEVSRRTVFNVLREVRKIRAINAARDEELERELARAIRGEI